MSAKIFEGFSSDRELEVRGAGDGSQVDLLVRRAGTGIVATGIAIAPSDAPALALAILEASGVEPDLTWSGAKDYGNADHLGWIAGHLGTYIKTQERVTAEAKERAELEAEALELFKAHTGYTHTKALSETAAPERWLAVARKAREMRAEK